MKNMIAKLAINAAIKSFESKGSFSISKFAFDYNDCKIEVEGLSLKAGGVLKNASGVLKGIIDGARAGDIVKALSDLDINGQREFDEGSIVIDIAHLKIDSPKGACELVDFHVDSWGQIQELAWSIAGEFNAEKEGKGISSVRYSDDQINLVESAKRKMCKHGVDCRLSPEEEEAVRHVVGSVEFS